MHLLKRLDGLLSRFEELFLGGTILFTSTLLFVNVILRYVFHHSIYWAEELVRYLMVWLIFFGGSQVVRREGHIRVDILLRALPPRGQRIWEIGVEIVNILMLIVLFWYSLHQCLRVFASGQVSPAMELPMGLVYLAVPCGSFLMIFRYVQRLVSLFRSDAVAAASIPKVD